MSPSASARWPESLRQAIPRVADRPFARPRAGQMIQSADIASRMLIFDTPARRFSNRIGVSPIRQPTVWHQYRISSWNEYPLDRT